jgi:hypothetical protein
MLHIAQTDPARAPRAAEYINFFGPLLWILRLRSNLAISAAPFSALVAIGIGVGLLLYQKWALTIALIDRVIPFIKLVIFAPVVYGLDKGELLSSIAASMPKAADILFTLFMAIYLFQPDVRRRFGLG